MSIFLFEKKMYSDLKKVFKANLILESDFNIFNKGRVAILKNSYKKV